MVSTKELSICVLHLTWFLLYIKIAAVMAYDMNYRGNINAITNTFVINF